MAWIVCARRCGYDACVFSILRRGESSERAKCNRCSVLQQVGVAELNEGRKPEGPACTIIASLGKNAKLAARDCIGHTVDSYLMTDTLTRAERSERMSRIRAKRYEMIVRRLVHSLGFRFRLHKRSLPGSPDLVFASRRKIILVHGCFWHGHAGCPKADRPTTNVTYWNEKLDCNIARDRRQISALRALGWHVLVIWQCETTNTVRLGCRVHRFLERC